MILNKNPRKHEDLGWQTFIYIAFSYTKQGWRLFHLYTSNNNIELNQFEYILKLAFINYCYFK